VNIFSWMLINACCLVVELALRLGLVVVSGWQVVMHTYLYYFRLLLSHSQKHSVDVISVDQPRIWKMPNSTPNPSVLRSIKARCDSQGRGCAIQSRGQDRGPTESLPLIPFLFLPSLPLEGCPLKSR